MIRYFDTRSQLNSPMPFTEVILQGLAPGGGLFVPERIPELGLGDIAQLAGLAYWEKASFIFQLFEPDLPRETIEEVARAAYGSNFDHPEIAPLVRVGDRYVLELWHGPTLAFKDLALQCMPLFFSAALEQKLARDSRVCDFLILVATSGDTGAAALSGFADRPHTKIAVCYPAGGVSPLQERQMTTQPGRNLTVFAVQGDFDACQRVVKEVFGDESFALELAANYNLRLSSANSINWGRLLPQVVYYAAAYSTLVTRGAVALGDPVDVCVPTGNFGNILAAYYAKRLGVPISRLLCASNANKVLADFLDKGEYDISSRTLIKTPSPSMDILVSSNLERLLFEVTGDGEQVRRWMEELRSAGRFTVDKQTFAEIRKDFLGSWVDNKTCIKTIAEVYRETGYLIDPHTAVAWRVAQDLGEERPVIVVSTAHWSKFPADVTRALLELEPEEPLEDDELTLLERVTSLAPGQAIPQALRAVLARPVRFNNRVAGTGEALKQAVRAWLTS
ncbi:MAG: threonine synthase [Thermoleophilia bacterium]|nr:threonine synthase [Thermoleophilia bacterium]